MGNGGCFNGLPQKQPLGPGVLERAGVREKEKQLVENLIKLATTVGSRAQA